MNIYLRYFIDILNHKINVFKLCWESKLYIRGILHDISKLSPREFIPSAEWFYGYHGKILENDYNYEQLNNGLSCLSRSYLECKNNYLRSQELHYKRNKHHWNYWKINSNHMPDKYIIEMICDWESKCNSQKFYLNNYKDIELDDSDRLKLESYLQLNNSEEHGYGNTLEKFCSIYDEYEFRMIFHFIEDKYNINLYDKLKK